jgi:hypothetical protein
VIRDAQADGEAERFRQPIGRGSRIGIGEHRNYNAGRDRTIESHLRTLSLSHADALAQPASRGAMTRLDRALPLECYGEMLLQRALLQFIALARWALRRAMAKKIGA